MIYKFIEYLTLLPTPATSPLVVALNTTEMKDLIFGNSTDTRNIALIDSYSQVSVAPYVLLRDSGQVAQNEVAIGGSSYVQPVMLAECVAVGANAYQAQNSSYHLAMAVYKKLVSLKGRLPSLTMTDLGGSGKVDSIQNFTVKMAASPTGKRITGPGNTSQLLYQSQWDVQIVPLIFVGA